MQLQTCEVSAAFPLEGLEPCGAQVKESVVDEPCLLSKLCAFREFQIRAVTLHSKRSRDSPP